MAAAYAIGLKPLGDDSSRRSAVVNRSGCAPCRYRFTPFGQSIPRLNGNSSHGSKPITSLSRTLSCTPHCCPQKQQWVFTRRSGSALVDNRAPAMPDRCGPKRWMIFSGSTGIVATVSSRGRRRALRQSVAPGASLRQAEQRPPAARTNLLVVLRALLHLVRESQLPFHFGQVAHHHRRGVRLSAAAAARRLALRARVL